MKKEKLLRYGAYALILIAVVVALTAAWQRLSIERGHKQSVITLEWSQVRDAARRENLPLEQVLHEFANFAGGVVIKEPTIFELQNEGRVVVKTGEQMRWDLTYDVSPQAADLVQDGYTYLIFSNRDDLERCLGQLQAKAPRSDTLQVEGISGRENLVLATSIPYSDLSGIGVGISQETWRLIEEANLQAVVQLRNWYQYSPQAVAACLNGLAGHSLLAVGFNDNDVPGSHLPPKEWKAARQTWVNGLQRLGVPVMTVEFFNQTGLPSLAMQMQGNVLRMHAVSDRDMTVLDEDKAVDRLQLAASERNIKLLLVRFLPHATVAENVSYFEHIANALWEKGVVPGTPAPAQNLTPQPAALLLLALGVLAGAWLLSRFFHLPSRWGLALVLIGLLGAVGLIFTGRTLLMQRIFALGAVLVFPTLSLCTLTPSQGLNLGKAILRLLLTTLGSLVGAVLMVGLMADANFMLGLQIFSGVKVAHLIPILLVAFWFLFLREQEQPLLKAQKVLTTPLNCGILVLVACIAGVLMLYLMRTGNENAAVPEWERMFRAALDQLLFVRPRTKEFAIGHPLLLLLFYWGYKDRLLPVLVIGAIGQVSLVNTFAHAHTPLYISGLRTVNGFVLGIIAGVVLIVIVNVIVKAWRRRFPQGLFPAAAQETAAKRPQ